MTVYRSPRALRDYLISTDEAARLIYVTENRIRTLAKEGYIKPGRRKGFYRLGDVIDGHAEAVRMQAIAAPHERGCGKLTMVCDLPIDPSTKSDFSPLERTALLFPLPSA